MQYKKLMKTQLHDVRNKTSSEVYQTGKGESESKRPWTI